MRILVVEDDQQHREELQGSLSQAKGPCPRCVLPVTFEVESVSNIPDARKMVQERGYDFVLLDIEVSGALEAEKLLPLLHDLIIPYAFYTRHPEGVDIDSAAPVWTKGDKGVRMDLVSMICDQYHVHMQKEKKRLSTSGRFCLGRL
jgi:CheY-like chemotaxis protein